MTAISPVEPSSIVTVLDEVFGEPEIEPSARRAGCRPARCALGGLSGRTAAEAPGV